MIENLDVLFADFAVEVTKGSATFKALFDTPDDLVASGLVLSTEYTLTVKTVDVSGVVDGDVLSIDGVSYEVRQIRKIDDGALSRVVVSKV